MTSPYTYVVVRVLDTNDGDTSKINVQSTPDTVWSITARVFGYDSPESRRTKCGTCGRYASPFELREAGRALALAKAFLNGPGDLWARLEPKRDDFGRQLVTLWHEIDDVQTSLSEALVDEGLASLWPTRWHEQFDPQRDKV